MKFHLIDSGFLKHPHENYVCYRKVICYSFFRYLKQNNRQLCQNKFTRMIDYIKKNNFFLLKGYIEIYPTVMTDNGNQGYFIIESSQGCFILVIRPETRKPAFETVIQKLTKNQTKIFNAMEKYNEWSIELEHELEKLFEYPKMSKQSNDANFNNSLLKSS